LTEEIVNGPMKDVRVATKRADLSKDLSGVNGYCSKLDGFVKNRNFDSCSL